jgi:predicted HicB family RNase H-like nuclease
MDRKTLAEHLEEAERHVALGERHIAEQRERISKLTTDGHDVTEFKALLFQFEETQVQHVQHRDHLLSELGRLQEGETLDKTELAIEVPTETKRAVERAAAAQGLSVSEFIEQAVKKMLADPETK